MALTQRTLLGKIDMLSNDNAFLNTFSMEEIDSPFVQRTLFTSLASPDKDPVLLAKPIFHLWTLFALQGQEELNLLSNQDDIPKDFSIMPSKSNKSFSILMSKVSQEENSLVEDVTLKFTSHEEDAQVLYKIFSMTDHVINPERAWIDLGRPLKNVTFLQAQTIRNASQLQQTEIKQGNLRNMKISILQMPSPSVHLVHICKLNSMPVPSQPFDTRFHAEESTNYLLIMWKYPTSAECLDEFLIEYSQHFNNFDQFAIVARTKSVNNFHFLGKGQPGWYRIRGKNFAGTLGPFSVPEFYR